MAAAFPLAFNDIIELYRSLEGEFQRNKGVSSPREDMRDVGSLLEAIEDYCDTKFVVSSVDLYAGLSSDSIGRSRDFYSAVLIFEKTGRLKRAEIYVNSHVLPTGLPLVNHCWKRFCVIKEACQVVIRDHLLKGSSTSYPSSADEESTIRLLHNIVKFKFSIEDFNSNKYPPDVKVENAAELLAILLLYPMERMVSDQKKLLEKADPDPFSVYGESYLSIAEQYKVPERYVDLLLSTNDLDGVFAGKTDPSDMTSITAYSSDSKDQDDEDSDKGGKYTPNRGPRVR